MISSAGQNKSAVRYLLAFTYLLGANLGTKAFGLLRELIIAAIFGASGALGFYLLLRSFLDIVSSSAVGVFQLNLVPRLSRLSHGTISGGEMHALFVFAIKLGVISTILSIIFLSIVVFMYGYNIKDYFIIINILSISLGILLISILGLTGSQASGNFGFISIVSIITSFVMAALAYPFGMAYGITGLALCWLVSVLIQSIIVWHKELRELFYNKILKYDDSLLRLGDARPEVIIMGNHLVISIAMVKIFSSFVGMDDVAIVNYSLFVIGIFVISLGRNMSSVIVKAASDGLSKSALGMAIVFQICIALLLYVLILAFGDIFISIVFERGAFGGSETDQVVHNLALLFPPFVLLCLADLIIVYECGSLGNVDLGLANKVMWSLGGAIGASLLCLMYSTSRSWAPGVFAYSFGILMIIFSIRHLGIAKEQ